MHGVERRTNLVSVLVLVTSCQAYDHARYRTLIDGAPVTDRGPAEDTVDVPSPTDGDATSFDTGLDAEGDAGLDATTDVAREAALDAAMDAVPDVAHDVPGCDASAPPADADIASNGGFESGLLGWSVYVGTGAAATQTIDTVNPHSGANALRLDITAVTSMSFGVQALQSLPGLIAGTPIELTVWARASSPRLAPIELGQGVAPYMVYCGQIAMITTAWQRFTLPCNPPVSDPTGRIVLDLGTATGSVWIDDVTVLPQAARCE